MSEVAVRKRSIVEYKEQDSDSDSGKNRPFSMDYFPIVLTQPG